MCKYFVIACIVLWLQSAGADEKEAAHSAVISKGVEITDYPIQFALTSKPFGAGAPCNMTVRIHNTGNMDVNFPLLSTVDNPGTTLEIVKVENEHGAQPADVPRPGEGGVFCGSPLLLTVGHDSFGSYRELGTSFIPWEAGRYVVTVRLRNTLIKMNQLTFVQMPNGGPGTMVPAHADFAIAANLWNGEVQLKTVVKVNALSDIERSRTAEGIKAWAKSRDEINQNNACSLQALPCVQAKELRVQAESPVATIRQRVSAINDLAQLKNEYAADELAGIAASYESDPYILPIVLRALYDMTIAGTGHRALDTICWLAGKDFISPTDKVLCTDLLMMFANETEIKNGKIVIHRVTTVEREKAGAALAGLKAKIDALPKDARDLLMRVNTDNNSGE